MKFDAAANTCTANSLLDHLDDSLATGLPLFVWGPPGVGKSEVIRQWSDRTFMTNYPGYTVDDRGVCRDPQGNHCQRPWLRDVRASLLDPVDLRGIPFANTEKMITQWLPCGFLPRFGTGVLFFDELPQATEMVQSALLQLVLDRQLGEYMLPPGYLVLAGGNRIQDGTFSRKLSKAQGSRFCHVEMVVSKDQWLAWAKANGVSTIVQSYIMRSPEALHEFNPDAADFKNENTFPCPRTWYMLAKLLPVVKPANRMARFAGTVGRARATEFLQFLQMVEADLPTLDEVIADPMGCRLPTDPSCKYIVANGFSRAVDASNFAPVLKYVGRMAKEYEVMFVNNCCTSDETLTETQAFIDWAVANPGVVLGKNIN